MNTQGDMIFFQKEPIFGLISLRPLALGKKVTIRGLSNQSVKGKKYA